MADGKIYITITDERSGSTIPGTDISPGIPKKKDDLGDLRAGKPNSDTSSLFGDWAKHQFFNFTESQAKQFISYSIGNIGNFTGSYQTQRQIQETLRIGNMVKNVGLSMLAGFKFGGFVGMAITGAIAVSSQTVNLIYEDYSLTVQTKQQNREIDMMRKISGLDGLTNGSRWGA